MDRQTGRNTFFIAAFLTLASLLAFVYTGGISWPLMLPNLIMLTWAYYIYFLKKEDPKK